MLLDDFQASMVGPSGPLPQAALLCTLSQAVAAAHRPAAGLIRMATETATSIEDNAQRALALGALAQAVYATGQAPDTLLASARTAVERVDDDAQLFIAQSTTAQVAITIWQPDLARQIAASIGDPVQRAWTRAAITYVIANTWQFEAVGALVSDMDDAAQRDWAWTTVAAAAATGSQIGVAWALPPTSPIPSYGTSRMLASLRPPRRAGRSTRPARPSTS